MDVKEAEVLLGGMITDGFIDEVFGDTQETVSDEDKAVDIEPTAMLDTEYDDGDDLEDI